MSIMLKTEKKPSPFQGITSGTVADEILSAILKNIEDNFEALNVRLEELDPAGKGKVWFSNWKYGRVGVAKLDARGTSKGPGYKL